MGKNKNRLSWKAIIAFIIVYFTALAWLLVPFVSCRSSDANAWEKLADDGTWAVIIAVFFEFPEIAAKTSIGFRSRFAWYRLLLLRIKRFKKWHDWLEKHEFQIDVLALSAWVFIMIGLMVELRANQTARGIQDTEFSKVARESADAKLLAAQTVSNNLVTARQVEEAKERVAKAEEKIALKSQPVSSLSALMTLTFKLGDNAAPSFETLKTDLRNAKLKLKFPPRGGKDAVAARVMGYWIDFSADETSSSPQSSRTRTVIVVFLPIKINGDSRTPQFPRNPFSLRPDWRRSTNLLSGMWVSQIENASFADLEFPNGDIDATMEGKLEFRVNEFPWKHADINTQKATGRIWLDHLIDD